MDKKKSGFIDVDRTVVMPSPQRVRNILTLEERVRAIQAYDCRPMYTKVAKMFNCSWEQIKNIIANREAIMEFYSATKKAEEPNNPDQQEVRQRKIAFLGECMYEYIQRAQFHRKIDVTEELIRMKAFEFRDLIQIAGFIPHKAWINHFKATYNFSLSNRQVTLTRTPPSSLDLKDIMTFCSKHKSKMANSAVYESDNKHLYRTSTKVSVSNANEATAEELLQRRQRKINFLAKALYEYIQRSQYHHKTHLDEPELRRVACDLRDMLKIDNFVPNKAWLNHFKNRFDFDQGDMTRTPLFSLDLKDILSYCSRIENKNHSAAPIKLAPKEPQHPLRYANPKRSQQPDESPKIKVLNLGANSSTKAPKQPPSLRHIVTETIEVEDDELDIKPKLEDLVPLPDDCKQDDCQPPPLKIQKIESMQETEERNMHSPGHWSEHSEQEEADLPKQVRNYEDALKVLKPLEEFAMLEENFRVIGLISQLEEIFKNPPKKEDEEY